MNATPQSASNPAPLIQLRLFVAGDGENSRIARSNLQRLIERRSDLRFEVSIIDVAENPAPALEIAIYVTPALQVAGSGPHLCVYGNLSREDMVDRILPAVANG